MHFQTILFYIILLLWVVVIVRDAATDSRGGKGSIIPNLCLGVLMLAYLYPNKHFMMGQFNIYYEIQAVIYVLAPLLLFVFYWFNWRPRIQKRDLNKVSAFLMYALMIVAFLATIALSVITILMWTHQL